MIQFATHGLVVAGAGTLAGVLMQAGVGDHNGALVIGVADGILITLIGLATTKAFTMELMISATDAIESIQEREEVSEETVLTTSIQGLAFLDAALMLIPALSKTIPAIEEVVLPADQPALATLM